MEFSRDFSRKGMAKRLALLREISGVNPLEMAKLLNMEPGYFESIEKGMPVLIEPLMVILLQKYDVNLNWLLSGAGSMFNNKPVPW